MVLRQHAVLVVEGAREIVPGLTAAPGDRQRLAVPVRLLQPWLHVQQRPHIRAVRAHPVDPLVRLEREGGLPGRAALREDLDHAGGGLGTVESRRRCALDHLHPIDVAGVDVREGAGLDLRGVERAASLRHVARIVVGGLAHPIHVDQRLIALTQRDVAAQANRRALPDRGPADVYGHARHARLQQRLNALRGLRHGGEVDLRDRVADLTPTRLTARPRHHDLLERERLLAQPKVHGRRPARGHVHGLRRGAVADALRPDIVRPGRDPQQLVAAVGVRQYADLRPHDVHPHRGERRIRARVHHTPDHTSFGLLPAQPRGCAGGERLRAAREQSCGQEYRQRSTHGILGASLNVKNSPVIPVATLQHRCSLPLPRCMGRACLAS